MAVKELVSNIMVSPPTDRTLRVKAVGISPLVVHAMPSKAKKQLLSRGGLPKTTKKGQQNPLADFIGAAYWLTPMPAIPPVPSYLKGEIEEDYMEKLRVDAAKLIPKGAKFGVKAEAFKAAMVGAVRDVEGMTMTEAKAWFFVLGDLLEIKGPPPIIREDVGRLNTMGKPPDMRYRPEFQEWEVELLVEYNENRISAESVVNLLANAGRYQGINEMRPGKSGGQFGRFEVVGI